MNEKKAALEVSSQEQRTMYPTQIVMHASPGGGSIIVKNQYVDTHNAIEVKIRIKDTRYPNEEVMKSLKEVFQKLLECFC